MPARACITATVLFFIILSPAACAFTGTSPPHAPHPVAGAYADCRSCHETGVNGAPIPDHIKKDDCVKCHKQQAPGGQGQ